MPAIGKSEAQEIVLARIAAGHSVKDAMAAVGRAVETYKDWRKSDPVFRERIASIRLAKQEGTADSAAVPDYPEFAAKYLRKPLPLHQLRAWDAINGREPRELHPAMRYVPGSGNGSYTILNFPPAHAKSTVWTVGYVVWRIHRNPNVRVVIVSKTEAMAKKFINQIQFILTSPIFAEMHAAFAPAGGWKPQAKGEGLSWRDNYFTVQGRTTAEKDYTVQALGMGSQIYGTRADLVVLDDIEDYANAGMFEKHGEWIAQDVFSRIEDEEDSDRAGELLLVGTRVAPVDIYSHLRDSALDDEDDPLFTYFSQPAILEGSTGPKADWVVLWPERLPAARLARKKAAFTNPKRFELIYQQNDIPDTNPFPTAAVQASINRQRYHGPLVAGQTGHCVRGMHGKFVVAGLDPAASGFTAIVVVAVDKDSEKRWVLDARNTKNSTPMETIAAFKEFTTKYRVNEWRIERNGIQRFITQLPELREFAHGNGARIVEHQTRAASVHGQNTFGKWDPDWGIETLIPHFMSCVDLAEGGKLVPKPAGKGRIELPHPGHNPAVAALVEQLQLWEPDMPRSIATDLVMALWFAEIGCKQWLQGAWFGKAHSSSKFMQRRALSSRGVIDIQDLIQKQAEMAAG